MHFENDSLEELKTRLEAHLKSIGAYKPSADLNGSNALILEELYSRGYYFYENGKYVEATDFFKVLTQLDAENSNYWTGLGACLQMQKKYNDALLAYSTALILDSSNPITFFHAATCCFALNHIAEGLKAIETAENLARVKPEHQAMLPQLAFLKKRWTEE